MSARILVLSTLLLTAATASATVFLVPSDAALVDRADAIVVGTVDGTRFFETRPRDIRTAVTIEVDEVLKGDVPETVELVEPGGVVNNRVRYVAAVPIYRPGSRVLLFLTKTFDGWSTWGMALGKFEFVRTASGREALVRADKNGEIYGYDEDGVRHRENARDARAFLSFVQGRARGETPRGGYGLAADDRVLPEPPAADAVVQATAFAPSSYTPRSFCVDASTCYPGRWFLFDGGGTASFRSNGQQTGAEAVSTAITDALAAWTNDPASNVRLSYAGTTTAAFAVDDGINAVVFNASISPIGLSQQFGGVLRGFAGEQWVDINETDTAIKAGVNYSNATFFEEILTHEMGHNLGFRHSDKGYREGTCNPAVQECTPAAIMRTTTSQNSLYGTTLQPWDINAVRAIYPGSGTPSTVHGDANGDFVVNGADVVYLVNYFFGSGPAPVAPSDVNLDGSLNLVDLFYLINYVFAGGRAPK